MTESNTANSTETNSVSKVNPTISTASISAFLIGVIQLLKYDAEITALLSTLIPLLVAAVVYGLTWLGVFFEMKPLSILRSEKAMTSRVKFLRKEIDIEKSAGRNYSTLENELERALIARSRLYDNEANLP